MKDEDAIEIMLDGHITTVTIAEFKRITKEMKITEIKRVERNKDEGE